MMKVPLLDIGAQLAPLREEIVRAVTSVIDSTRYIMGPEVEGLEERIGAYSGCGYGIGVSSGTDALLVSLMALEVKPGDLIVTTPYSFFATMGVILRLGARPLFVDIDPVSFNIEPQGVADLLEGTDLTRVKAILPVHLYGQCADMDGLMDVAGQYGLPVIEDAAQAIGAEYPHRKGGETRWQKAGAMGICGCFSFFPSKNLGGVGDGGMVVSKDQGFADTVRLLRNHGAWPKYYHELVGGNFRLDPIQAAVLNVKHAHLEEWHQGRRRNAESYNALFVRSGLVDSGLVRCPVAVYQQNDGAEKRNYHIYNQYVIRVQRRDALRDHLQQNGIGCEVYYPVPLHRQKCLGSDYGSQSFPWAEQAADETLALPIYAELTPDMQEYVVEMIKKFYS